MTHNAVPDDAQDFSFTAGGGLSPASFSLDDDLDPTLASTRTFNDVPVGSGYSIAESVPAGWDLASATCDDGSPVSNIGVSDGETVTCTFTNHKRGQIVAVKDATPNDPQDFAFTAGGGLSPTSFSLDDDADGTLSNTRTFAGVPAGNGYSLSETVPGGWDQTSATCGDGSPVSNIDVAPGETVTCTFANSKRGSIVIVKDAQPNDAQDFAFTAGGGLSPTSFSLDDDADGTLSNTRTFANVAPGAGYSVSETVPSGWDQSSATCDDGSPVSNISVSAAETVTCTFVNKRRGQIVVVHGLGAERCRRTSTTRPAVGCPRAASSSMTTRTRRCRTPSPSPTSRPTPATRSRRPCRPDGDSRAPPATTAARFRTSTSGRMRPSRAPS